MKSKFIFLINCLIVTLFLVRVSVIYAATKTITSTTTIYENTVIKSDLILKGNLDLYSNQLEIKGNLFISEGILNVNGGTLIINGNLIQSGGTLFLNSGIVNIKGDYRVQTIDKKPSKGILKMVDGVDYLEVTGNFVMHSTYGHSRYLTHGTLAIKGNFTQKYGGSKENFICSYPHKNILNSENCQTISFDNSESRFGIFEINKPIEAYTFYVAGKKINPEDLGKEPVKNKVTINGKEISNDIEPQILNGRLLVPIRGIFESLGGTVNWNNNTRSVIISKDNISITIVVNSKSALVNSKTFMLDVPAKIINGKTFVPLRFISESLGAKVSWDDSKKTAEITIM